VSSIGARSTMGQYTLFGSRARQTESRSRRLGIPAQIYYLTRSRALGYRRFLRRRCRQHALGRTVISLPMHPLSSTKQPKTMIIEAVLKALGKRIEPRRGHSRSHDVSLFDFDLPAERIALRPRSPRDSARMMWCAKMEPLRTPGFEPAEILRAGDLVVGMTARCGARAACAKAGARRGRRCGDRDPAAQSVSRRIDFSFSRGRPAAGFRRYAELP